MAQQRVPADGMSGSFRRRIHASASERLLSSKFNCSVTGRKQAFLQSPDLYPHRDCRNAGSSVSYTPAQVQSLTPVRIAVETKAAERPDLRDVFLCHAWDDRQGAAKQLHDLLEAAGVKVWFSEKDLGLGVPMMRAIDKGLAASRIGLVLVTPALLARLPKESVADKELSALLAGNRLVPIVHNTTYEALRNVSPLLASRSGLDTTDDSMAVVATKIAELVAL